jgi:hypothetical protein
MKPTRKMAVAGKLPLAMAGDRLRLRGDAFTVFAEAFVKSDPSL